LKARQKKISRKISAPSGWRIVKDCQKVARRVAKSFAFVRFKGRFIFKADNDFAAFFRKQGRIFLILSGGWSLAS
jgi:hypothetical protein